MFQLIAILVFFILGLAFFAIGKDDFGIKRIKEDSNDSSSKNKKLENTKAELSNRSSPYVDEVNTETNSDSKTKSKISD